MLTDLTAERLKIKYDEKTLREKGGEGDNSAKVQLAILLMRQSPEKDMECNLLLHQVLEDGTADKGLKIKSLLMLGDLAVERKSYMLAEHFFKEAMDMGYMHAIEGIRFLYQSGKLTVEKHHNDYDYIYRKDIDLARKIANLATELGSMRPAAQSRSEASNNKKSRVKRPVSRSRSGSIAVF